MTDGPNDHSTRELGANGQSSDQLIRFSSLSHKGLH